LTPCSPLTGGYCKARKRLPESLLQRLVGLSGQRLEQQVSKTWHWHGQAVKIVEGSGESMPDTPIAACIKGTSRSDYAGACVVLSVLLEEIYCERIYGPVLRVDIPKFWRTHDHGGG
jgi:hypothetical protein